MKNIRIVKECQIAGKTYAPGENVNGLDNSIAAPLLVSGAAEEVRPVKRIVAVKDAAARPKAPQKKAAAKAAAE